MRCRHRLRPLSGLAGSVGTGGGGVARQVAEPASHAYRVDWFVGVSARIR
jgi:hypothetical protein